MMKDVLRVLGFITILGLIAWVSVASLVRFVADGRCDAGRREPKASLLGLCDAERRHFERTGRFTSDLQSLELDHSAKYPGHVIGFARCSDGSDECTTANQALANASGYWTSNMSYMPAGTIARVAPRAIVTSSSFVAAAAFDLDTDFSRDDVDVWTVDQSCVLVHVRNDCLD